MLHCVRYLSENLFFWKIFGNPDSNAGVMKIRKIVPMDLKDRRRTPMVSDKVCEAEITENGRIIVHCHCSLSLPRTASR
jgi:hypothetical protein